MVDVILGSLDSELVQTLFSIGAASGFLIRYDTSFVSEITSVLQVELMLVHSFVQVRVLSSGEIVIDSGLSD